MRLSWVLVTLLLATAASEAFAAKKTKPPRPTKLSKKKKKPPPPPPFPLAQEDSSPPSPVPGSTGPTPPSVASPPRPPYKQPNFVVVLVDDQDYLLNATNRGHMPLLHKYIGDEGLHLDHFIVSTSACCPSRVNLLTGMYTHNSNVTSNQAPQGSFSKFQQLSLDNEYLPKWMRANGYATYFTGKFMNGFNLGPGDTPSCPKYWDTFDPLTDASVYNYKNFDFLPQCAKKESFRTTSVQEQYQTDVMKARSLQYIEQASSQNKPFYLQINPAACHTTCDKGVESAKCSNPVPADRHVGFFDGVSVPRLTNWGIPMDPSADLSPAREDLQVKGIDRHYQARLETMLAVDEMIEALVLKLDALGQLDNTYVLYISDNGYHLGNHNLAKGKQFPMEEDVRVPFYIRGPGIPRGIVDSYMATMVDLSATFVALAGGVPPAQIDGVPIPLDRIVAGNAGEGNYPNFPKTTGALRQMLPIEMWANSYDNKLDGKDYRSVRVCANVTVFPSPTPRTSTCYKYTIWCIKPSAYNFKELYDLGLDPGEINNRIAEAPSKPDVARLVDRLDALLTVMGYCKGATCQQPWKVLHPAGDVATFEDAMNSVYDIQYSQYNKYVWLQCAKYYDPFRLESADLRLGAKNFQGSPKGL